jgi:hypothetical protein
MKLIKHNAIENFNSFSLKEKEDLLIQEMSKSFIVYPQAVADVLDQCKIEYKSIKPSDLSRAVESSADDLKMINRIVRISFLVNKSGDNTFKDHNRNTSYRNLMRSGSKFVKSHGNEMKEATLITRELMRDKIFSKMLGTEVSHYLNLDGEDDTKNNDVAEGTNPSKKFLWMGLGATILVGLGVWWYLKNKKSN